MSMLRKYIPNPDDVLNFEPENLDPSLTYTEDPLKLPDQKTRRLKNKDIPLMKIQWKNHSHDEVMWKLEKEIEYPDIAGKNTSFGDKIFLRGRL